MEDPPKDWIAATTTDELPEAKPMVVNLEGVSVLLYKSSGDIYALSSHCTHAGGPLNEGKFDESSAEGLCVTCPWHQSVFNMRDGSVVHGPATVPEPSYEVRVTDGKVEVRAR
jgi:nitrite reductase/ring-hydroxylating ferredoxin subunit